MNFCGLLVVRVNPLCSITKRIAWGASIYGDSVMLESNKTNLIQLTLFCISFVMMSGLGSQASIMLLTTQRIEICAKDGDYPLLY